ncbi:hypothetical protein C8R44DRAFT_740338 [Mycena epipterygia]|nr:hypothetical protein C8R44DRAFT_740338 [Mycena epipterygia]
MAIRVWVAAARLGLVRCLPVPLVLQRTRKCQISVTDDTAKCRGTNSRTSGVGSGGGNPERRYRRIRIRILAAITPLSIRVVSVEPETVIADPTCIPERRDGEVGRGNTAESRQRGALSARGGPTKPAFVCPQSLCQLTYRVPSALVFAPNEIDEPLIL